jgi:hypothetical protein
LLLLTSEIVGWCPVPREQVSFGGEISGGDEVGTFRSLTRDTASIYGRRDSVDSRARPPLFVPRDMIGGHRDSGCFGFLLQTRIRRFPLFAYRH